MIAAVYGFIVYVFFLATFVCAILFVGNVPLAPKTIDTGQTGPMLNAIFVNVALLGFFAVQHSLMARRGFKRWWTRIVPTQVERSTYVLAASLALALLLWQWRPITSPVIWDIAHPVGRIVVTGVFWSGWAVLLISTFLINHFELFGLRQVWLNLRGQELPAPAFRAPLFYRYVRHPIYLGFLLAFWATPQMTAGHLLFATACTGYILIGVWFEEHDLLVQFGERYRVYRTQVGMLVPKVSRYPFGQSSPPRNDERPKGTHQ